MINFPFIFAATLFFWSKYIPVHDNTNNVNAKSCEKSYAYAKKRTVLFPIENQSSQKNNNTCSKMRLKLELLTGRCRPPSRRVPTARRISPAPSGLATGLSLRRNRRGEDRGTRGRCCSRGG